MTEDFDKVCSEALNNKEEFWSNIASAITWDKKWNSVLDTSRSPFYRWFSGGRINTCYNALDRHIDDGRAEQCALIYDSPITNTIKKYSYKNLRDRVAKFSGALANQGVKHGDRVVIYMPMIPEAVVAMLACARIGAIHSVVFGGFASHELAVRIDDAMPKVIVSASCGLEPGRIVAYKPLLDEAIKLAKHKPIRSIIVQRDALVCEMKERDLDWNDAMSEAKPHNCVSVDATDPLYILYTSGTTGQPKGVVRDNGGHAVALNWSMGAVYDVKPGDVYWAASDIGWVVGHSYIVYGPLLAGATTILYEGKPVGTPDAGAFWRVISDHKVSKLFTAPTAFRAIKREDPAGKLIKKYSMPSLKALFLAGERSDPDTLVWAEKHLNVPVIDHWWQTETGWSIVANCLGIEKLRVKHGSPSKPVPGWDLSVVDEGGKEVKNGEIGALVLKLPLPPGSLLTLWNADERYHQSYLTEFPGYYQTADAGYLDEDGYVYVMSRTDDIINTAGHRLSTGAMEEVLASHPDVGECAVVGTNDALKGQVPLGFLVLNAGVNREGDQIVNETIQLVRDTIGPVASFKTALIVERLPKTRSGKILRGTLQKIANSEPYVTPATIDDPEILEEVIIALNESKFSTET
ncbi:MAG: propionyl-CoA synthetase [Rhodospirillales bacterium]|nr:propionyl-CoA synthetase [Rhodospirillales bacterium]